MTIQYLVTGREGFHNWDGASGSAITKTYGFKEIEDICKEWFDEIGEEQRVEIIKDKFNQDCIRADIDGEEDWEDDDYEDAYSEENNWNCVDLIFRFESPAEIPEPIYAVDWSHD